MKKGILVLLILGVLAIGNLPVFADPIAVPGDDEINSVIVVLPK